MRSKSVESLYIVEKGDKEKLKNLLDFELSGDMLIDDYLQDMKTVLADDEKVLDYAIEDLYQQGKLLQNKYKYLKMAFRALGFGMLTAVIASLFIQFLS